MTITEIVDLINTRYEAGMIQGIAVSILESDNTFKNAWHIHESQPSKYLLAVGMADSLKQDIHLEAMIKDEALKFGD